MQRNDRHGEMYTTTSAQCQGCHQFSASENFDARTSAPFHFFLSAKRRGIKKVLFIPKRYSGRV